MISNATLIRLAALSSFLRPLKTVSVSPYGDYGFALEHMNDGVRLCVAEVENQAIVEAVNSLPGLLERLDSAEEVIQHYATCHYCSVCGHNDAGKTASAYLHKIAEAK